MSVVYRFKDCAEPASGLDGAGLDWCAHLGHVREQSGAAIKILTRYHGATLHLEIDLELVGANTLL
jgi:hypothetical protein